MLQFKADEGVTKTIGAVFSAEDLAKARSGNYTTNLKFSVSFDVLPTPEEKVIFNLSFAGNSANEYKLKIPEDMSNISGSGWHEIT